jgi:hypothetical protein
MCEVILFLKVFTVTILMVALLFASGCQQSAYRICAKGTDDVAQAINQGITVTDQLRVSGLITPAEERDVLGYYSTANALNAQFQACVANAHAAGNAVNAFSACATTLLNGVKFPAFLTALHVVNPDAQAKVNTYANALQAAITGIIVALGRIKAPPPKTGAFEWHRYPDLSLVRV